MNEVNEINREKFKAILYELAQSYALSDSKQTRAEFYLRFEELYHVSGTEDCNRHYYSDIFEVAVVINDDASKGSLDLLVANISELCSNYRSQNKDPNTNTLINVQPCLRKLYDHLNLEVAHIQHIEKGDRYVDQSGRVTDISRSVKNLSDSANALAEKVEENEKKFEKMQTEYIAILGIFASIVLAFVGGLTFSTSVFNNIASTSAYKLIFSALVVGLVFTTIIYVLFYYVGILTDKGPAKRKTLKPLWLSYFVICALMIAVVVAWYVGAVEWRNDRIAERKSEQSRTTDTFDEEAFTSELFEDIDEMETTACDINERTTD